MTGSIHGIESVGLVQAGGDLADAFGGVDGQRRSRTSAGPAQHAELAEPVDMIRMKVRQEDGFDARRLDTLGGETSSGGRSGIDEVDSLARNDREARCRASGIRQRTSRSAEHNVQAVGKGLEGVGVDVALENATHDPHRDRTFKYRYQESDAHHQDQDRQQDPAHA